MSSVAHAVVIKDGDLFLLTGPDGDVPLDAPHGLGLYHHDCRFLDGYTLRLAGMPLIPLICTASDGFRSVFELTNPSLDWKGTRVDRETLGLRWERTIDADACALRERLSIRNFGLTPLELPLRLRWRATFEDVFTVRGLRPERRGRQWPPFWDGATLRCRYDGADGILRTLDIGVVPPPTVAREGTAEITLVLEGRQSAELAVTLVVSERHDGAEAPAVPRARRNLDGVGRDVAQDMGHWLARHANLTCDRPPLVRAVDRSLRDLRVLRSELEGRSYFAAGVPWYVALFGRDSCVAALESLAWDHSTAESTLRLLAARQGTRVDARREEEPGKILHELRVGEMAHLGEIPHTPYYGSVDATPLFLILLARHGAWTGDLELFRALQPSVHQALAWIERASDLGGYLCYRGSGGKDGLRNQGWKDSRDAICNADGTLATPPIALAEVQGYVYRARLDLAVLYEGVGASGRARTLRDEAERLKARFNRDFWNAELGTYSLALQKDGRPVAVVASNAGQVLWSGIAEGHHARATVARLTTDDMWTGWGIRTLSTGERRYNPVGYHVGSVWPHDNALISAGFRRYGFDAEAVRVFEGVLAAASHFAHDRLPEVFSGFARTRYPSPVRYPVACHPQAWAAGAIPYLVESCLGLVPEGFDRRLRIVRPVLPSSIRTVTLEWLRIADATVTLHFERRPDGRLAVEVRSVQGNVDVVVADA